MTTDFPELDPQQQLAAFADGELDEQQSLQVLHRLKRDPATVDRIAEQHKLRRAVAAAIDGPQYKAPAELRDRIRQLALETAESRPSPVMPGRHDSGSPVLAVIGRWVPAAIAAVLLIGALLAINHTGVTSTKGLNAGGLINATNSLNSSIVERFGSRHFTCTRNLAPMHGTDRFPQNLTELPGALSEYFHQPIDPQVLDFSALGYEFDVAGLCIIPGNGAVHVVYKSQAPTGRVDSLSLWMRPYEEGSGIEPDKLYASKATQETYPMIVWRHGELVYYLLGDDYQTVERAFNAIRQTE